MSDGIGARLARNLTALREARGLTQQQIAKLADMPRATWTNLESGEGNPTLAVLHRAAQALGVSIEELLSEPKAALRRYPKGTLPTRHPGDATVQRLLPDPIPGMDIERIELPVKGRMPGTPHTAGTREYLTCERGKIQLVAAGEKWELSPGDVLVFRGDQRHSYTNIGEETAVGYSVITLAREVC
ncbi:MAG: XRE family transcriptional regulator [Polyangiaceae bacterium]